MNIKTSPTYTGSGNLSLAAGTYSYFVSNASLPKIVNATGTVNNVVRRVLVTVSQTSPKIQAVWQEP